MARGEALGVDRGDGTPGAGEHHLDRETRTAPARAGGGRGTAYGIRTRVTGVRGQRPRPLDERGTYPGHGPFYRIARPRSLDEELARLAVGVPARGDSRLARVEIDRIAAMGVQIAEERVLPAREREEGHGRRDADVHADHPGVAIVAVAAGDGPRLRKERGAVAVARAVDDRNRLIQRVDLHDREHRAE